MKHMMFLFIVISMFQINVGFTQEKQDSIKTNTISDSLKDLTASKSSHLNLIDIKQAWLLYQPATLDPVSWRPLRPKATLLDSLVRRDIENFMQNRLDPEIDSLLQKIQTDSLNHSLYNSIGVKYGKSGFLELAEKYFLETIKIDSTFYKAINNIGNVHFKKQEFEGAYAYYKQATSLNPADSKIYLNLAYVALELAKIDEATEWENRAFEIDQELSPEFHLMYDIEKGEARKADETGKPRLEPIWID